MRNPARLVADLSGRPLLLREAALPALARTFGLEGGERRSPLATFFGRARALLAQRDEAETVVDGPSAYAPRWLGEPEDAGLGWTLHGAVGCIEIDTALAAEGFAWGDCWFHGYDTILTAYEEMIADARVKAIFEVIRSPGGVVDAGLPELARFKREHRQAAGGKPIWTFARDAYSAAYWIAAQSDRILAARESGVGSIGAVVGWCGFAGALEQEGIEYRAFKFGPRKTDASPLEPLSDRAAATLQAEIDQCGRWFVADVIAGRPGLTEARVLATEAGCFFGDADEPALSGLAQGLVDGISTERAAFEALAALVADTAVSPAAPAASAAPMERDMKRSAVLAAARKAGLNKSQIRKLEAELPDEDETEDEDETDPAADEEEDKDAPAGDDETAEDGDEEDEAEDEEVDPKTARAILDLPEARGREDLAKELAFTPRMTVARARRALSKAPVAGGGKLQTLFSGSPRLGPDGKAAGAKPGAIDTQAIYRARAARGRRTA